jgi:hypothetical protein
MEENFKDEACGYDDFTIVDDSDYFPKGISGLLRDIAE